MEVKHCKHCGKELHPQASFCPYCIKSQIAKQTEFATSKPFSWKWLLTFSYLLFAIGIGLFLIMPKHEQSPAVSSMESITTAMTTMEATTVTTTSMQDITTKPTITVITSTIITTINNYTHHHNRRSHYHNDCHRTGLLSR